MFPFKSVVTTIEDEFKNFVDANEEHLEQMFNEQHSFKTSVRGIKVRGSFNSQEEAEQKCKMLREIDANHDIFVGPVGTWWRAFGRRVVECGLWCD